MPITIENNWEKLHAIGYSAQIIGDFDHARMYFEQTLKLKPDYAYAQLALAQLRMFATAFREGRDGYELRFSAPQDQAAADWRHLPIPRWRGESLEGKRIYLWAEQGLGDMAMFAAFLPWLLAQSPAHVTLGTFPKTMALFARSFSSLRVEELENAANHALAASILELFPKLEKMAELQPMPVSIEPMREGYERAQASGIFDYAAPMGDLLVYGLPGFIPAQKQNLHLRADEKRVASLQTQLLSLGHGQRIGISWHTPDQKDGAVRSIPLAQWQPIISVPGYHFFSLQHHAPAQEIQRFCAQHHCRIIEPDFDPAQDTESLAALISCMDQVITIDNSNAHLAGALGVPTTVLLPKGCNFRWPYLENSADNLWYRSVKLARQEVAMDWSPVIARIAAQLS